MMLAASRRSKDLNLSPHTFSAAVDRITGLAPNGPLEGLDHPMSIGRLDDHRVSPDWGVREAHQMVGLPLKTLVIPQPHHEWNRDWGQSEVDPKRGGSDGRTLRYGHLNLHLTGKKSSILHFTLYNRGANIGLLWSAQDQPLQVVVGPQWTPLDDSIRL